MTNNPSASPQKPDNAAGAGRSKASPAATPTAGQPGAGQGTAPAAHAPATRPDQTPDKASHDAATTVAGLAGAATTAAHELQESVGHLANQAVAEGKKLVSGLRLDELAGQLPQTVRDLGRRLAGGIRGLSTTQKVVGGTALALGLGWLATRGRRSARSADAEASDRYREKFDGQPFSSQGKPRYAGGAVQPGYGRSGKY